ncbi:hypothetical protein GCM10018954_052310 [Kutzneria kofuensis]
MTPEWVKPTKAQVDDLHWLSYRVFREQDTPATAGIVATLAWVRGGRPAPITERDTQPVSAGAAQFEQWAAVAVMDPDGPCPPLELLAAQSGVPYLPPQATNPKWAHSTWRTLLWLAGATNAASPIPVPRRHPDGTALTEDDFLRELLADPRCSLPEARAQARIDAAAHAQRNRGLVALIDQTQRELGAQAGPTEQLYTYRPNRH